MKKLFALLLALCMVLALAACGQQPAAPAEEPEAPAQEEPAAPAEEQAEEPAEPAEEPAEPAEEPAEPAEEVTVMSYEEFVAAEQYAPVVIESYVQAKQAYAEAYGNTSLYLQDEEGAYFVYRIPCTAEEYETIAVGQKIRVTGMKDVWSGEVEIANFSDTEPMTFEMLEGTYTAEPVDVTEALGTEELAAHMNQLVSFKGMTVEEIGEGQAFLYNWDGSGEEGSDLYFNVSLNGEPYNFTVESDLCGSGTDVYEAVKALKVGDVIDLEGFLYWYNGANPHITAVTVK